MRRANPPLQPLVDLEREYAIAVHVLGALKHTFWDKDGNLWRMLRFGTPRGYR